MYITQWVDGLDWHGIVHINDLIPRSRWDIFLLEWWNLRWIPSNFSSCIWKTVATIDIPKCESWLVSIKKEKYIHWSRSIRHIYIQTAAVPTLDIANHSLFVELSDIFTALFSCFINFKWGKKIESELSLLLYLCGPKLA